MSRVMHLAMRPDTVLRWHRDMLARRHARRSRPRPRRPGRPRTARSVRALVLRLARENPGWGYRRVHGELLVPGAKVAASTSGEILHEAGTGPAPERCSTTWDFTAGSLWRPDRRSFVAASKPGRHRNNQMLQNVTSYMANSDEKTAEQVNRLRKLIEASTMQIGQSVRGGDLRNACHVYSTWQEQRFNEEVTRRRLARYDRGSDTYTIVGG